MSNFINDNKKLNHQKSLNNKNNKNYFQQQSLPSLTKSSSNNIFDDIFNLNIDTWRPTQLNSNDFNEYRLKGLKNKPTELKLFDGITNLYENLFRFMADNNDEKYNNDNDDNDDRIFS